ncbi:SAM-dependent methyltransferase [Nocardiopsis sp. CNT-189]|uniref:SAM-dependent methyltransferase n=1 Tax=Nocardiopsis oceanisediminis TaxID=2816862 RepID=UPI003B395F2B
MDDAPDPGGTGAEPPAGVDTRTAHSARIWNYWLGSKDHYPVDREVGEQIRAAFPGIAAVARAQRAFLRRAVTHLAAGAGIRQFLDIGTGLPTHGNTHEVAQAAAPEARVVYADNDPMVLAHARALLTGSRAGATDYLHADLRDPEAVLDRAARTLDFDRPVGLLLLGVLAHVTEDAEASGVVRRLLAALPSGSHLVLCDSTAVIDPEERAAMARIWNEEGSEPRVDRSPERIAEFFAGLELLEPGVVSVTRWRPDPADVGSAAPVDDFGGVGRKP